MTVWTDHVRKLKLLLRRRGQSREDAEDLVQEAFIRLHSFLSSGRAVHKPEAFLARTVMNLAVDARRRYHSEHRDQYLAETVENLPLVDLGPSPEEVLSARQRLIQMRRTLDSKVNPRTRKVFFLHRLEGYTHEEIGQRMHMSVRTVEKHIARAVTALWMERQKS